MKRYVTWTKDEDERLRQLWTETENLDIVSKELGRTKIAIKNRLKRLGIKNGKFCYSLETHQRKEQEKLDKLNKFCEVYKEKRYFLHALKELHLARATVLSYVDSNENFRTEFYKIKEYIDSTFRCSKCKNIFKLDECYHNLECNPTAHKVCKPCGKQRRKEVMKSKDIMVSDLVNRAKRNQTIGYAKGIDYFDLAHKQYKCTIDSLDFDIDKNFIIYLFDKQEQKCYYSGIVMILPNEKEEKRQFNLISIDRKDSTRGYTKDNICLCCWGINRMKGNLEEKQFIELCKQISEHTSKNMNF